MTNNAIVMKLWNLCNVLRDDGISYHEYVTELTYILFLKMAAEIGSENEIPLEYKWENLRKLDGIELRNVYQQMLLDLGKKDGDIGIIYRNAKTSINEPANLKKIFVEIDKVDWYDVDREDLGDLYEGLLEKNSAEKKSGAGQYFTPRVLISMMVRILKPQLMEKIWDPAAGTFGFVIEADRYLRNITDDYFGTKDIIVTDEMREFKDKEAFSACELVEGTHRLGTMNAFLHDVTGDFMQGDTLSEAGKRFKNFDLILSNPPFGTKSGGERATRDDLVYASSNKQLNFLEVIYRSLKLGGRAGVIVPDNVLFEGGVGKDIRVDLLNKCNVHTILRLPTGIFYAQGVKTNILFFDRGKSDKGNTQKIWYYDLRTNMPNFGKTNPLSQEHLKEFEESYFNEKKKEELERWTLVTLEDIEKKDYSLDLGLIRDESLIESENLPNPIESLEDSMDRLEEALDLLRGIVRELKDCGVDG